jgi:hypothetical protein
MQDSLVLYPSPFSAAIEGSGKGQQDVSVTQRQGG